jgi:hypothetical protein
MGLQYINVINLVLTFFNFYKVKVSPDFYSCQLFEKKLEKRLCLTIRFIETEVIVKENNVILQAMNEGIPCYYDELS